MFKDRSTVFKISLIVFMSIVFLIFISFFWIYFKINQNKTSMYPEIEKIAKEHASLTAINRIERYHGDEAFYVVFGEEDTGEAVIVFIPFTDKDDENDLTIETVQQSEIISEEEVLKQWAKDCSKCDLVKIVPGQLNEELVWEITYTDEQERYVFDYVSLFDGKLYEKLRFRKFFE